MCFSMSCEFGESLKRDKESFINTHSLKTVGKHRLETVGKHRLETVGKHGLETVGKHWLETVGKHEHFLTLQLCKGRFLAMLLFCQLLLLCTIATCEYTQI